MAKKSVTVRIDQNLYNNIENSDLTKTQAIEQALTQFFMNRTIENYDYPLRNDIENIFNKLLQKEKNTDLQFRNIIIRRNLLIKILENYYNKEFTYDEIRINLNDRYNEEGFYQHFEYLAKNNFIENITDNKFKFCDRVKKWKIFDQI